MMSQAGLSTTETKACSTTVLAVTGGIAMGKSTIVEQLRTVFGIRVHDSDRAVHRLYASGGAAVEPVVLAMGLEVLAPDGGIDRGKLSAALQKSKDRSAAFAQLEAIVHPLVKSDREAFIAKEKSSAAWLSVVDIPLLFESSLDLQKEQIDKVLVVSCGSEEEQRRRALERPGMNLTKLDAILARQLKDTDRKARADFVIDTSHREKAVARAQLAAILETLFLEHESIPKKRRSVRRISIDLDDCLWTAVSGIKAGQLKSQSLMPDLMPKSHLALNGRDPYAGLFSKSEMSENSDPQKKNLAHDITAKRRLALHALAQEHGDPIENADAIIEALVHERSLVAANNLMPGALELIEDLRDLLGPQVPIGAFTNGNARPIRNHALSNALDFWLMAEAIGAPKPRLASFLAVTSCPPGTGLFHESAPQKKFRDCSLTDLVHIGDSLVHDGLGALRAGARAIIIPTSRDDIDTTLLAEFNPDDYAIVDSFDEIPPLIERWNLMDK